MPQFYVSCVPKVLVHLLVFCVNPVQADVGPGITFILQFGVAILNVSDMHRLFVFFTLQTKPHASCSVNTNVKINSFCECTPYVGVIGQIYFILISHIRAIKNNTKAENFWKKICQRL